MPDQNEAERYQTDCYCGDHWLVICSSLNKLCFIVSTFGPTVIKVSKNKPKFRLPKHSNFLIMASAINVQLATYSFAEDSYDGYDVV